MDLYSWGLQTVKIGLPWCYGEPWDSLRALKEDLKQQSGSCEVNKSHTRAGGLHKTLKSILKLTSSLWRATRI